MPNRKEFLNKQFQKNGGQRKEMFVKDISSWLLSGKMPRVFIGSHGMSAMGDIQAYKRQHNSYRLQ